MISPHCAKILEQPISKDICYDFRAVRARVMCTAWQLMETEHIPFRTAISKAWDKIKDECSTVDAHI